MIAIRSFLALILIGIVVTIATTVGRGQSPDDKDLTGSWLLTINQLGEEPEPYLALATFTQNGGFVAEAQGHSACCPQSTGAFGTWERTGESTFAGKWASILFNPDQSLHSTLTFTFTIDLNQAGDQISSEWQGKAVDLDERVLFTIQGTMQGEQIQVDAVE